MIDMHCIIVIFLLQMLLLMQMDVTARVEIEVRMTALNETQINFLDQVRRWIRLSVWLIAQVCMHS